jgi:hypothetical protein
MNGLPIIACSLAVSPKRHISLQVWIVAYGLWMHVCSVLMQCSIVDGVADT